MKIRYKNIYQHTHILYKLLFRNKLFSLNKIKIYPKSKILKCIKIYFNNKYILIINIS